MLFAMIFLACFVLLGGLVMYLSQTIDHGEARFDANGKVMRGANKEKPRVDPEDVKPAKRLDKKMTKASDDE